jgi:hypothetical protein
MRFSHWDEHEVVAVFWFELFCKANHFDAPSTTERLLQHDPMLPDIRKTTWPI